MQTLSECHTCTDMSMRAHGKTMAAGNGRQETSTYMIYYTVRSKKNKKL